MKYAKFIARAIIIIFIILMGIFSLKYFCPVLAALGMPFTTVLCKWRRSFHELFLFIVLILLFLSTFLFGRSNDFKTKSALAAFFASLLFEMYGVPFSIYTLCAILGYSKMPDPSGPFNFPFRPPLGIRISALAICCVLGVYFIMKGWKKIWNSKGGLVTDGIYGYLRHPQYLGLALVLFGLLIYFPAPLLICFFSILVVMYYRLARKEERELELKFGGRYKDYKNMVPMFIPYKIKTI